MQSGLYSIHRLAFGNMVSYKVFRKQLEHVSVYLKFTSALKIPPYLFIINPDKSDKKVVGMSFGAMCHTLPHNIIFLHLL